ncbi:hypothetical protein TanjilG_03243 [Lupinus angustifolius]|uniref:Uncharacterized protein n=1 Tax=Lupinus angustifolius TaxID=3871 RepID=A0A4P1RD48_LUPAN|nr:PREDICTED: vegetative cell wall protein gp1-like [Lupinus angustifolius]OIW08567.1 hypothetical protein TanjilG_03243 [Lupinus angustifolius]
MPISTISIFSFSLLFLLSLKTTSSAHSPLNSPATAPQSPLPPSPTPAPTTPPPLPSPAPAPTPTSLDSPPSPSPDSSLSPAPEPASHDEVVSITTVKDAHGESSGKSKAAKKAGIAVGVILSAGVIVVGTVVYRKRRQNIERSQFGNAARRELL